MTRRVNVLDRTNGGRYNGSMTKDTKTIIKSFPELDLVEVTHDGLLVAEVTITESTDGDLTINLRPCDGTDAHAIGLIPKEDR